MLRALRPAILLTAVLALVGCAEVTPGNDGDNQDPDLGAQGDVRERPDLTQDTTPINPDAGDTGTSDTSTDGTDGSGDDTTANQPPSARAAERLDGQVGQPVTFDGSASTDPDGTLVDFKWDFGDGSNPGDGTTITHTYTVAGVYEAELTVEDDGGLTDTAIIEVRITSEANQPPTAVITLSGTAIAVDAEVAFSAADSSDPDGTLMAYTWSFRDAASGDEVAIGNGVTVAQSFDTPGQYEARLEVIDNHGAVGSDVEVFTVGEAPTAQFTITPEPATVGSAVAFDASTSTDPAGGTLTFEWDFGDGSGATGVTANHTYSTQGDYVVTLVATNTAGFSGEAEKTLAVRPLNGAPTANAGLDRVILLGDTASFDGRASTDADGSIVSYSWDFGDGFGATGATAFHVYASGGVFTVTLTVTDDDGGTATDTCTVRVNRRPNAAITVLTATPQAGQPTSFSGNGSLDPDGDALISYFWNFGDGGTASVAEPTHTFAAAGSYPVSLTVTDTYGATGNTTLDVVVACVGAGCSANGTWRVRPLDLEANYTTGDDCFTGLTVTVPPLTCAMSETAGALDMNCGVDVYTGTRTGDDFAMQMIKVAGFDPWCGDVYIDDIVWGTFVTPDRWEGFSSIFLTYEFPDDIFCIPCVYEDFVKTGTRQ